MRSKATAVMVNYRKLVNVEDFEQWTWDELVGAARKATDMRYRIEETIKTTYGDYIARLTMASAVKRGGIKEFCEEAGLNYGTVKNWRSQYLTAEQKREYKLKEPEPEPEPERETIVILNDNSSDKDDDEFEKMFPGQLPANAAEILQAHDLDDDRLADSRRAYIKDHLASVRAMPGSSEIVSITVAFDDGDSWTYFRGRK